MRGPFRFLPAIIAALTVLFYSPALPALAAGTEKLSFTDTEEEYIATHGPLRIGYIQDRVPVSFINDKGELDGISRYIFDRVSRLTGLKFEYIPLPIGDVTYDFIMSERLDLVSGVEQNKENHNARGIVMSDPYFTSRKVVVGRNNLEFSYDANLSVAVPAGSQTIEKVLAQTYPNFDVEVLEDVKTCFDAVNSSRADLVIQNQYVVEHWIAKPIYEKLKVIPVLGLDDEICFSAMVSIEGGPGTPEEEGQLLIGILNKAIAAMTEDELGSYAIQAVMDNQYRYNLSDFLYRYRYAVGVFVVSTIIILILVILLARQQIKIAEDKADAKVKSRFLSTMSHEIRTPLNGIIGLNYVMSQKLDDKERLKDSLRQSTVTANYLLSLVNDMLDMSGLQTENIKLTLRPVDLRLVVSTVSTIAENSMSGKNIKYNVRTDLKWPCVLGDEVRIQQVLLNLLDNARKFTQEGGTVSMMVRQTQDEEGKVVTTATVRDNGRGMSEEFQKHIFNVFAQELDTVSKGNQGTGLGLPISRRLARLMGGDITFVSERGEGSAFTFTFTADPSQLSEDEDEPVAQEHIRILVAEDNELNGEIIIELLSDAGYDADLAENGRVALDMFSKSEPGFYGLVLMDLLMPEMDGFQAAEAIRALDRPDAGTVRIFACTANACDSDRERAFDSGMDDFITKPVDMGELIKKINQK